VTRAGQQVSAQVPTKAQRRSSFSTARTMPSLVHTLALCQHNVRGGDPMHHTVRGGAPMYRPSLTTVPLYRPRTAPARTPCTCRAA
jgi:hypothetical protein